MQVSEQPHTPPPPPLPPPLPPPSSGIDACCSALVLPFLPFYFQEVVPTAAQYICSPPLPHPIPILHPPPLLKTACYCLITCVHTTLWTGYVSPPPLPKTCMLLFDYLCATTIWTGYVPVSTVLYNCLSMYTHITQALSSGVIFNTV